MAKSLHGQFESKIFTSKKGLQRQNGAALVGKNERWTVKTDRPIEVLYQLMLQSY